MFNFCTEIINKLRPEHKEGEEGEDEAEQGQDHVFAFYDKLSEEQQQELDDDFDALDVDQIEEAFVLATEKDQDNREGNVLIDAPRPMNWELKKPPGTEPGANLTRLADVTERKLHAWRNAGFELYFKGRVAIVILSGGMDSRLGENVPKGVLDIGLLSHKSIFQLYCERIRRLQHLVHRKFKRVSYLPIYIMCNRDNAEVIEDFFRENNFFGLREQDLMFFVQGYVPVLSKQGKLLLKEKHKIAQYPCGNGGMFRGLAEEGMVSDMKSRCVTSLYVCSIDNVLAKVGDPLFIGYCETCKAEAGLKCIEKLVPEEKFGVYCSKRFKFKEDIDGDGKLDLLTKYKAAVFEFFEISDDQKKRRSKDNAQSLEFCAGNLSQYFFRVDFVMRVYPQMSKVWHLIPKAFRHVDPWTGEIVNPRADEKNAWRLEMWVFDSFEYSGRVVGLQVPRNELALVKNVTGSDSPSTALQAVGRLHQQWILTAGGGFVENKVASDRDDAKCEISPLVSYEGEDLNGQFPKEVQLPYYLPSQQEFSCSAVPPVQTKRASIHYLDWEADLAQRELEVELQSHLGVVLETIGEGKTGEYQGERAEQAETLPPTPRIVDTAAYLDDLRSSPRGASTRQSQRGSIGTSARGNAQNTDEQGKTTARRASQTALSEANKEDNMAGKGGAASPGKQA